MVRTQMKNIREKKKTAFKLIYNNALLWLANWIDIQVLTHFFIWNYNIIYQMN